MAGEWQVCQTTLHKISFAAFAELCGGKGFVMTTLEAVGSVIRDTLDHHGPTLCSSDVPMFIRHVNERKP